jgi:uncharacterized membrane protein YozB (DUF420 family)
MKKRDDLRLFNELQRTAFWIGLILVVVFITEFFTGYFEKYTLSLISFICGLILIRESFKRYLRENSKARTIARWVVLILILLLVLGIIIFFLTN